MNSKETSHATRRVFLKQTGAFAAVSAITGLVLAQSSPVQMDEYARYDLSTPATGTYRISYEVSAITSGATTYVDPIAAGSAVTQAIATDLMTGAPLKIAQTPKEVVFLYQSDHQVRHIYMNVPHSKNVTPSWYGESVGHYENGDTLVVDTIGLAAGKYSFIDNFRTPHSDKLHVVERFTLAPDGNSLSAVVTVDDPDAYNGTLTMTQRWFKFQGPMLETVCSENNEDHFSQGLADVPTAGKPDF